MPRNFLGFNIGEVPIPRARQPFQQPEAQSTADIIFRSEQLRDAREAQEREDKQKALDSLTDSIKTAFSISAAQRELTLKEQQARATQELLQAAQPVEERLKASQAGLNEEYANLLKSGGSDPIVEEFGGQKFLKTVNKTGVHRQPITPLGDKPLSTEGAKVSNLAESGTRAVDKIYEVMNSEGEKGKIFGTKFITGGIGGSFLSKLTGDEQSQIVLNQIREATDAIARLRTGAAITKKEEEDYGELLMGRFKTIGAYNDALRTVSRFLKGVSDDINAGRRTYKEAAQ